MIFWKNVQVKVRTTLIIDQLHLSIGKGESLGIIGVNGTGKTILAKAIAGIIPVQGDSIYSMPEIKSQFVSFQSSFKMRNGFAAYRQQRWNNIDPDSVPTVTQELNYAENWQVLDPILERFNFKQHLTKFVISLSNGEQRKLELIRALSQHLDLLVIDNAFNGLDADSRELLSEMLDRLIKEKQSLVLTGLKKDDFPESITRFVYLDKGSLPCLINRSELIDREYGYKVDITELPKWKESTYDELISVENICLNYGEKSILKDVSWRVNAGEQWVLSGGNGAGKTSLLNLIFADNPKAYGCKIKLFGREKGSGESIWDIKKQIGFISPELQQYLPQNQDALKVICSGLFDSEGLYNKPTSYQLSLARSWLLLIGDISWANRRFGELSSSEQRIVLIIRTLIKNPPLLLLDEPFQGLDAQNVANLQYLLNLIAEKTNCAMVFVTHLNNEIPAAFNLELRLKAGEIVYKSK